MSLATLISSLALIAQAGQTQVYQCPLPNGRLIIMYPKEDFGRTYIAESVGTSINYNFISDKGIISALDYNRDGSPDEVKLTILENGNKGSSNYEFPKDIKTKRKVYDSVKELITNFKRWFQEWQQQQPKSK